MKGLLNKFFQVRQRVKSVNPLFLLFQETHLSLSDYTTSFPLLSWEYRLLVSHCSRSSYSGVVIGIRKSGLVSREKYVVLHEGYVQCLNVFVEEQFSFLLVNLYLSTDDAVASESLKRLRLFLDACTSVDSVIIVGDFNCTLVPLRDRLGSQEYRFRICNELSFICNRFSLTDVWPYLYPNTSCMTFCGVQSHKPRARLDRFYVGSNILPFMKKSTCTNIISDHAMIGLILGSSPFKRRTSVWVMNSRIVSNPDFAIYFEIFWSAWVVKKSQFADLSSWWDVGKVEISRFAKEWGSSIAWERRVQIAKLEQEIFMLEQAVPSVLRDSFANLVSMRKELRTLNIYFEEGALVRSRGRQLHGLRVSSPFLFTLEATKGARRTITCLTLPDGSQSSEPDIILNEASRYYKDLYSFGRDGSFGNFFGDIDIAHVNRLPPSDDLQWLLRECPILSELEKWRCDKPLTLGDLSCALKAMKLRKAPGLDGLTVEFYKKFWHIIGPHLLDVFSEAIDFGQLTVSQRLGLIILLPKKGDLFLLDNWRPLTLMGVDYKLFAKVFSMRLTPVLPNIIHPDQTCGVTGRSIFDNIALLRDIFDMAEICGFDGAILGLDQRKAFDQVSHYYLAEILRAFGFGNYFRRAIGVMYHHASAILKINGLLSSPFDFAQGVRQGCPISGQLFLLSLEPLLIALRRELALVCLKVPRADISLVVSAYADDVNVFLGVDSGFPIFLRIYKVYSHASGAELNLAKCKGYWLGAWRNRVDSPLGFIWTVNGDKFLGVFLGPNVAEQNWVLLWASVEIVLARWSRWRPFLSYQVRAALCNSVVAGRIWHRVKCLTPPSIFIENCQRLMINFIWTGKHWFSSEYLSLSAKQGGLGLLQLSFKVEIMRIKFVWSMLHNQGVLHSSYHTGAFLLSLGSRRLGWECFLSSTLVELHGGLNSFWFACIQIWHFAGIHLSDLTPVFGFRFFPLEGGLCFHASACPCSIWTTLGLNRIDSILDCHGNVKLFVDIINDVRGKGMFVSVPSERRLERNYNIWIHLLVDLLSDQKTVFKIGELFLPSHLDLCLQLGYLSGNQPAFPGVWKICPPILLIGKPWKRIYSHKVSCNVSSSPSSKLESFFSQGLLKVRWDGWGSVLLSPSDADFSWRFNGCRLASVSLFYQMGLVTSRSCPQCFFSPSSFLHVFLSCSSLVRIFALLLSLISPLVGIDFVFTNLFFLCGCSSHIACPSAVNDLITFLIVLAKSSIYFAFLQAAKTGVRIDPCDLFLMRLRSRMKVEFAYARLINDIPSFQRRWLIGGILGSRSLDGESIILNF